VNRRRCTTARWRTGDGIAGFAGDIGGKRDRRALVAMAWKRGKSATALRRGYWVGSGVPSSSSVFIGAGSVANNVLRAGKGVGF
jgi:hypothetical protein